MSEIIRPTSLHDLEVALKVRSKTNPRWRNKVGRYPCGILEQAYREVKAKGHIQDATPAPA